MNALILQHSMRKLSTIAVCIALAGSACDRSELECPECRIVLTRVAALTTENPAGQALYPATLLRHSNGTFLVGPTLVPGTVAVFDRDGTFMHSLGRYGEGPGEMREVASVNAWFGDSVAIVHDRNQFLIFSDDASAPRSGRIPSVPFIIRYLTPLPDNKVIAVRFGTGGGDDYRIREFSALGEPGQGYGETMPFGEGRDHVALTTAGDTVWAIRRSSYEIDAFSRTTGQLIRTVARRLDWFPPSPERNEWGGAPQIIDLARSAPGRFWVLIRRPRPEFRLPQRPPATSGPVPASAARWGVGDEQERYEFVLELLDLNRGVPITVANLGNRVAGRFMDGDHLYGYDEDPNTGSLTIVLWHLSVANASQ